MQLLLFKLPVFQFLMLVNTDGKFRRISKVVRTFFALTTRKHLKYESKGRICKIELYIIIAF